MSIVLCVVAIHNLFFFFQAEDGIRDKLVTGVQTCALPIFEDATLEKRGAVTLPANVQYAWPHPSKQYFYVVSSGGGPGVASDKNFANTFQIDPATGALTPHGQPQNLPSRPIHTSVDIAGEYLLTAYNDPSSLTVHRINRDGTLGARVD